MSARTESFDVFSRGLPQVKYVRLVNSHLFELSACPITDARYKVIVLSEHRPNSQNFVRRTYENITKKSDAEKVYGNNAIFKKKITKNVYDKVTKKTYDSLLADSGQVTTRRDWLKATN